MRNELLLRVYEQVISATIAAGITFDDTLQCTELAHLKSLTEQTGSRPSDVSAAGESDQLLTEQFRQAQLHPVLASMLFYIRVPVIESSGLFFSRADVLSADQMQTLSLTCMQLKCLVLDFDGEGGFKQNTVDMTVDLVRKLEQQSQLAQRLRQHYLELLKRYYTIEGVQKNNDNGTPRYFIRTKNGDEETLHPLRGIQSKEQARAKIVFLGVTNDFQYYLSTTLQTSQAFYQAMDAVFKHEELCDNYKQIGCHLVPHEPKLTIQCKLPRHNLSVEFLSLGFIQRQPDSNSPYVCVDFSEIFRDEMTGRVAAIDYMNDQWNEFGERWIKGVLDKKVRPILDVMRGLEDLLYQVVSPQTYYYGKEIRADCIPLDKEPTFTALETNHAVAELTRGDALKLYDLSALQSLVSEKIYPSNSLWESKKTDLVRQGIRLLRIDITGSSRSYYVIEFQYYYAWVATRESQAVELKFGKFNRYSAENVRCVRLVDTNGNPLSMDKAIDVYFSLHKNNKAQADLFYTNEHAVREQIVELTNILSDVYQCGFTFKGTSTGRLLPTIKLPDDSQFLPLDERLVDNFHIGLTLTYPRNVPMPRESHYIGRHLDHEVTIPECQSLCRRARLKGPRKLGSEIPEARMYSDMIMQNKMFPTLEKSGVILEQSSSPSLMIMHISTYWDPKIGFVFEPQHVYTLEINVDQNEPFASLEVQMRESQPEDRLLASCAEDYIAAVLPHKHKILRESTLRCIKICHVDGAEVDKPEVMSSIPLSVESVSRGEDLLNGTRVLSFSIELPMDLVSVVDRDNSVKPVVLNLSYENLEKLIASIPRVSSFERWLADNDVDFNSRVGPSTNLVNAFKVYCRLRDADLDRAIGEQLEEQLPTIRELLDSDHSLEEMRIGYNQARKDGVQLVTFGNEGCEMRVNLTTKYESNGELKLDFTADQPDSLSAFEYRNRLYREGDECFDVFYFKMMMNYALKLGEYNHRCEILRANAEDSKIDFISDQFTGLNRLGYIVDYQRMPFIFDRKTEDQVFLVYLPVDLAQQHVPAALRLRPIAESNISLYVLTLGMMKALIEFPARVPDQEAYQSAVCEMQANYVCTSSEYAYEMAMIDLLKLGFDIDRPTQMAEIDLPTSVKNKLLHFAIPCVHNRAAAAAQERRAMDVSVTLQDTQRLIYSDQGLNVNVLDQLGMRNFLRARLLNQSYVAGLVRRAYLNRLQVDCGIRCVQASHGSGDDFSIQYAIWSADSKRFDFDSKPQTLYPMRGIKHQCHAEVVLLSYALKNELFDLVPSVGPRELTRQVWENGPPNTKDLFRTVAADLLESTQLQSVVRKYGCSITRTRMSIANVDDVYTLQIPYRISQANGIRIVHDTSATQYYQYRLSDHDGNPAKTLGEANHYANDLCNGGQPGIQAVLDAAYSELCRVLTKAQLKQYPLGKAGNVSLNPGAVMFSLERIQPTFIISDYDAEQKISTYELKVNQVTEPMSAAQIQSHLDKEPRSYADLYGIMTTVDQLNQAGIRLKKCCYSHDEVEAYYIEFNYVFRFVGHQIRLCTGTGDAYMHTLQVPLNALLDDTYHVDSAAAAADPLPAMTDHEAIELFVSRMSECDREKIFIGDHQGDYTCLEELNRLINRATVKGFEFAQFDFDNALTKIYLPARSDQLSSSSVGIRLKDIQIPMFVFALQRTVQSSLFDRSSDLFSISQFNQGRLQAYLDRQTDEMCHRYQAAWQRSQEALMMQDNFARYYQGLT